MFKKFVVINRKILPYQKNVDKDFFDIEKITNYTNHKLIKNQILQINFCKIISCL